MKSRKQIFIVRAGQEEAIKGFSLDGRIVALRKSGETLEALQERAEKALPDNHHLAIAIFRPIIEDALP